MNTIILSDQEKNVLLQLIDLAIKAGGLNVAEAALVLSKKNHGDIDDVIVTKE